MKKLLLITILMLAAALAACSNRQGPSEEAIEGKKAQLEGMSAGKVVSVTPEPYMGALPVRLTKNSVYSSGIFAQNIALNKRGTLPEICAAVSEMTGLPISAPLGFGASGTSGARSSTPSASPSPSTAAMDADLKAALGPTPPPAAPLPVAAPRSTPSANTLRIQYNGTVKGLLDLLATKFGCAWDYTPERGISFSADNIRTFTLLAAPGKVSFSNKITNESGGQSGTGAASSQASFGQTAQSNSTELTFDVWKDVETEVKSLLSASGSVTINQAAGTITVKDNPQTLQQVERYIDALNDKLGRQIALSIKVWSLEIEDSSDIGVNLQMFFENPDIKVFAGASPLQFLGAGGELSAAIVDGKLKGSTALLKGLRSVGKATQVTSGGGVVMSNQPVPVQAIKREAYLASSSRSQSDIGDTTALQPGEVTTGFAMTVIPHILEGRRVVLQYTVNLSNLDDLTEFKSGESTIQLPKVSTRSFSQRMTLKMGQTLVLAGFEQERDGNATQGGIFGFGKSRQYKKSMIIITISTESGEV